MTEWDSPDHKPEAREQEPADDGVLWALTKGPNRARACFASCLESAWKLRYQWNDEVRSTQVYKDTDDLTTAAKAKREELIAAGWTEVPPHWSQGVDLHDCRHLRPQVHRPVRRERRPKSVARQIDHARAYADAQGLDGRRRARLRRRRHQRRRVRQPARVPAADERAEAAAAVPGARDVRGVAARPRGDRDGLRAEAARAGRRARVLLPRGPRAHARLARPTRSCCR